MVITSRIKWQWNFYTHIIATELISFFFFLDQLIVFNLQIPDQIPDWTSLLKCDCKGRKERKADGKIHVHWEQFVGLLRDYALHRQHRPFISPHPLD